MSIRRILILAGLAWACTSLARAADPAPQVISLTQALTAASSNLDVSLARRLLSAAQADVTAANRSPFPTLSAKTSQMDLENGLGGGNVLTEKRIDKSIGLDWTWERGNKRELRTQAARSVASAAQADVEDVRTQQLLATQAAFFDLLAAQQRLLEVQAIEQSASQLAQTAVLRVKAGDLAAQDAARTDIEAQRARGDVQSVDLDRRRAALVLTQLLGLNTDPAALSAQADWPDNKPVAHAEMGSLTSLIEARSDVRAAVLRLQAAQAARDSAAAQKSADITIGSSLDHYPGTSSRLLELRMQMPLQWGYQYQGEIARAEAVVDLAQDALEKTRRTALSELQRLQQELLTAAQRAQRYDNDILPQARKVAAGADLAYSKGALSLTDLLDARRTLRATLLEALNARTDFAKARSAWLLRTQADALLMARVAEQPKPRTTP
jgi:cobalt-zinc-cadmium efflux system outer membrane protein